LGGKSHCGEEVLEVIVGVLSHGKR